MNAAARPNPALEPFRVLVGEWHTRGTHPYLPGVTVHGRATFEWLEGGAFLITRAEIDHPQFPAGVSVLGSDDASGTCYMLYFDERGVSRKYDVTVDGNVITWWRDDPHLSQRFTVTITEGADELIAQGRMSKEGGAWEDDLRIVYSRRRDDSRA